MSKEQIGQAIADAERELQTLLQERTGLNARRAEAEEADNKAMSVAHGDYLERTRAGEQARKPVAFSQHIDEVETRARAIPVEIDKARLQVAQARLDLVTLERAQALDEEKAPREKLERIQEEVAQLEKERLEADQAVTSVRRRAEVKMEEGFVHRGEIRRLEEAVNSRTRVASNWGVVVG
jgi:chromosome segregation ATPase